MALRSTVARFSLFSPAVQVCKDYEAAIDALNGLQSNAQYLANLKENGKRTHAEERVNSIVRIEKYLMRSGISNKLNDLKVLHVTGTKGKGSTCAFCESILRHNGLTTGFFSSPHLLEVRERIKVNGSSISKTVFASHFWELYEALYAQRLSDEDVPSYFMFLTILAFKIFLEEKVNVAVIEVGIGGELDSTNVVKNVPVVGITSLDIDHTNILGSTIQEIAWQKAGIMKKGCVALSVPQLDEVTEVFKSRSIEKDVKELRFINENDSITSFIDSAKFPTKETELNATLAVALSKTFMENIGVDINGNDNRLYFDNVKAGILNCKWPGRFQKLTLGNKTFFVDGAHTGNSTKVTGNWFHKHCSSSGNVRVLIFNATNNRDIEMFLRNFQWLKFNKVVFVPNIAKVDKNRDMVSRGCTDDEQQRKCELHKEIWMKLDQTSESFAFSCVDHALNSSAVFDDNLRYDVLVTGSLHLVGAFLSIVDPDLKYGSLMSDTN